MDEDFPLHMLALDTALSTTGYAHYAVARDLSFKLKEFGTIETDSDFDRDIRVRDILNKINKLIYDLNINAIYLEEPEIVFTSKFAKYDKQLAIAHSLLKVSAACYGIIGQCHATGMYCRTLKPREWQSQELSVKKNKRKKSDDSKVASIKSANAILIYLKRKDLLRSRSDSHVADAINIGIFAIKNFKSKTWEYPIKKES